MKLPKLETIKAWMPFAAQCALCTWIFILVMVSIFYGDEKSLENKPTIVNSCIELDGYKICDSPTPKPSNGRKDGER